MINKKLELRQRLMQWINVGIFPIYSYINFRNNQMSKNKGYKFKKKIWNRNTVLKISNA